MFLKAPLVKAQLIRRYKRFLADVEFPDGSVETAHVANPGGMIGLTTPGATVWLSRSDDPKRKLKLSWELIEVEGGALVGVNTAHPNRIVEEALRARKAPELASYGGVRREVKYGANSRVDFLLEEAGLPPAYVEVKNVHLRRENTLAEFPDAVTARGAKHLAELTQMVAQGARAVMFYLIQRNDCDQFRLAGDIDAAYLRAYREARAAGVEAIAYDCRFTAPDGPAPAIELGGPIEILDADMLGQ
ncbi:MAG: DNA/RNA nuclease SfsA [Neomegalonema sp.]|nr:DNA/RNA nuclease SfsA [Neomegalonema sp.]